MQNHGGFRTLRKTRRWFLAVVGGATLAGLCVVFADKHAAFDKMLVALLRHSVTEVRARDALDLSRYVVLDARERDEFAVSHLPGAQWIGYRDFSVKRLDKLPRGTRMLVYCSVGYRSEKIAEQLKAAGYSDVTNLVGGIFEWANFRKPLITPEGKSTHKVHPYDAIWGQWLDKLE